jgi:ATP-binding cassette, subfamily B, bacterial
MRDHERGVSGDLAIYRRLLREARPYWPHIGVLFLLSLLSAPIALLTPLPLKIAVDSVVSNKPLPGFLRAVTPDSLQHSGGTLLVLAVALLVVVALLQQLQVVASSVLGAYTGERLQLGFRSRLFRHVQRLSLAYHDARGTSDATYRIQYDAPSIQWIAVYGVTPFVTAGLTLLGMVYVTVRLDWELALVALGILPLLYVFTALSRRRLRGGWRETKNLESSAMSIIQEALGSLRVVKAFVQEDREHERFLTRSGEGMRKRIRLAAVEGGYALAVGLTTAVGSAAVLYLGVRHVQSGQLTLGSLLLVMTYLLQLYAPLQTMSKSLATLQSSFASAERAFTVLDEEPDVEERPDALPLARARGAIAFEHVSFGYPAGPTVIHDLSLEIAPGTRLGIAGATGSGKTTLVNLLMRLYDPSSGRILLDGVDVRDYRVADLRNQFAIVLQEPVLFSATVAENIAYGRQDASVDKIVAAAEGANAHDFVEGLPDGYDTMVGERGMRLSGGERQRIALARAFLKDAPILVLDEPTSSVDVRTEALIMEAMERLMRGRTTLMIAHRLGTLDYCDARIEVADGRIVDSARGGGLTRLVRR